MLPIFPTATDNRIEGTGGEGERIQFVKFLTKWHVLAPRAPTSPENQALQGVHGGVRQYTYTQKRCVAFLEKGF